MSRGRLRFAAAVAALAPALLRASVLLLAAVAGTGCPLDDGTYHEGDVVIADAGDVERRARVETITGDLVIRGTALRAVEMPLLQGVLGSVIVEDNAALATLRIPDLGYVGNLAIERNPALTDVTLFGEVRSPGDGRVVVVDNDALANLSVRTADIDVLEISDNAALGPLRIEARTTRLVAVARNAAVTQLDVFGHDGALTVADMPALVTLGLTMPRSTALSFRRNDSLTSITLLRQESIGDLDVEANAGLRDISMPALTSVTGRFDVRSNPALPRCRLERLLAQLTMAPAAIALAGNDESPCGP
jgi:hypothetical protein